MTTVWIVVAVVGVGTVALKGAGPFLLGRRELPPTLARLLALLPPPLLAALVVTQTFVSGHSLVLDARVFGLGAAVVAVVLRAPLLAVLVAAAAATAIARAVT